MLQGEKGVVTMNRLCTGWHRFHLLFTTADAATAEWSNWLYRLTNNLSRRRGNNSWNTLQREWRGGGVMLQWLSVSINGVELDCQSKSVVIYEWNSCVALINMSLRHTVAESNTMCVLITTESDFLSTRPVVMSVIFSSQTDQKTYDGYVCIIFLSEWPKDMRWLCL